MTQTALSFPIRIDSDGNPLLEGGYAPIEDELTQKVSVIEGEIPTNLSGGYVRNGPNPRYQPRGRYHMFDGDGMLHSATFEAGEVTYRNRWIRTRGFELEGEVGNAIWPGLLEMPDRSLPEGWGSHHWLKDASNTDVVPFNGKLLTTFYQCGVPYIVDALTLETVGPMDVEGLKMRQVSAHSRTDLDTGEFMFFDYDVTPPYMTYGVLNADGTLRHFTEIDLPGPRLPHDMAITPNYSVLMDLSLFWNPELLKHDVHKVEMHWDLPSRFAVLPRYAEGSQAKWFEVDPCYIYHVVNCWEEGDEVVLDVCRMRTPEPAADARVGNSKYASLLAWASMDAQLYRYRMNMKTGDVKEGPLDDQFIEFPTINQHRQGKPNRQAFAAYIPQGEALRMGGLVGYDMQTQKRSEYVYGAGVYASEPVFAPFDDSDDETSGVVMTFVEDMNAEGASELHLFQPDDIASGPIARLAMPQRMPMGFHACWSPAVLRRAS